MESNNSAGQANSRPYRSHKAPACNLCRKRKIRCEVDVPGSPCRLCRYREARCEFSATKHQAKGGLYSRNQAHGHSKAIDVSQMTPARASNDRCKGREQFTSPEECDTLIANPTMAEDIDILEAYITSQTSANIPGGKQRFSQVSKAPNESVLYLPAPRRRPKLSTAKSRPGSEQREIMDQVLGPMKEDIIRVYFAHVHPCLPMVDEHTFLDLWNRDRDRISPTLICDMYAIALPYWAASESLKWQQRPDSAFAWNQAVAALRDDFTAPSITTIHSALINLSGRPALEMRDNLLNVGRTVSLAHSLGLHRNPTRWQIVDAEKSLRIRLWWTVLIHDYWSSLTHGTPPNVHDDNFDVPLPSRELLGDYPFIFINLCSLTQVLGNILPLMYTLHPKPGDMWRSVRRIECSLDELEESFAPYRQHHTSSSDCANGESNLVLCFLTLRMVVSRVALRAAALDQPSIKEVKEYRLAMLRESTMKLTNFIASLEDTHFREFWLPYASHILVSATTVLLRCIAETRDTHSKRECAHNLANLIDRLDGARTESEWELADICLERYREVVQAVLESLAPSTVGSNSICEQNPLTDVEDGLPDSTGHVLEPTVFANTLLPMDSFVYPSELFWSDLDGLFPFSD